MNLQTIKSSVTLFFGKSKFWLKKNSPTLLMIGGIVMAGTSVVTACKATMKLNDIIKPANEKLSKIREDMHDDNKLANGEYTVKQGQIDLLKTYLVTSGQLVKLYALPVVTFSLSVASLLTSHKIMKNRNLELAAAYTLIKNGYDNYRDRVRAKLGEKIEDEIYRDVRKEKITEVDENGKEVKKEVVQSHMNENSDYSILFDSGSPGWEKNAQLNLDYLIMKCSYLNKKLITQGYLFLQDVYDELGYDIADLGFLKSQAARVVGWLYDPSDPTRDSYVSFGLTNKDGSYTLAGKEMLAGERSVWLEFNVDGDILTGDHNKKTFVDTAKIPIKF